MSYVFVHVSRWRELENSTSSIGFWLSPWPSRWWFEYLATFHSWQSPSSLDRLLSVFTFSLPSNATADNELNEVELSDPNWVSLVFCFREARTELLDNTPPSRMECFEYPNHHLKGYGLGQGLIDDVKFSCPCHMLTWTMRYDMAFRKFQSALTDSQINGQLDGRVFCTKWKVCRGCLLSFIGYGSFLHIKKSSWDYLHFLKKKMTPCSCSPYLSTCSFSLT